MKYSDIRQEIKTGDLLGFTHTATGSWYDFQIHMVRKATESEFSHIGIAYVVNDRVFILEAVSQGVRIFPLSRSLPFYWMSNPKPLSSEALEWAFAEIGAEYESKWRMVLNNFIDLNLKNNKRYQCSEYVNEILRINQQSLTDIDTPSSIIISAMRYWGSLMYVD